MTERAGVEAVPKPIKVGPEMAALRRFLPEVVTWEGTIHEGGMGPGTPAMRGIGRGTARLIQDGRWVAGDYEQDQFVADGTFVLTWQLHWVSGWAPQYGEYRATMADNYGNADVYRGHIEGDQLIFESMAGAGTRLRFTWDASDPGVHQVAERDGRRRWLLVPHRGVSHGAGLAGRRLPQRYDRAPTATRLTRTACRWSRPRLTPNAKRYR